MPQIPPAEGAVLLEEYLRDNPQVGGVRPVLARAYSLAGRPADAEAVLALLLRAHPDDPGVALLLGSVRLEAGQVQAAAEIAEAVIARHPESARAWALAGEGYRRSGDCRKALDVATRGRVIHPDASLLWLVAGTCRLEAGDAAGAATELDGVLARDPDNPDVRTLLATAYAQLGEPGRALELFREQDQRSPGDYVARSGMGLALYALGRFEEALPYLEEGATVGGFGPEPAILLADVLLRVRGDRVAAERAVREAERMAPQDVRVRELRRELAGR